MKKTVVGWFSELPGLLWFVRLVLVFALLVAAWKGFLWLRRPMQVREPAALVMVWTSVGLLLATLFPGLLGTIRRLKFGDLEIEIAAEVNRATEWPPTTPRDDGAPLFAEKGGPRQLTALLSRVVGDRQRPVLLTVDVGDGSRISVRALHLYLFVLTMVPARVVVVFKSGMGRQNRFRGVIDGGRLAKVLRRTFPAVWDSLHLLGTAYLRDLVEGRTPPEFDEPLFEFFTRGEPFQDRLALEAFELSIVPELRDALVPANSRSASKLIVDELKSLEGDWVVLTRANDIVGVVDLCRLAKRLVSEPATHRES